MHPLRICRHHTMGSANFFFVVLAAATLLLAIQGSNYGNHPSANLSTLSINKHCSRNR
ncbi:hypothetical protein BRADI_4g12812v3 [Brachypodium distachyon]|uniref:Uncharacterized protein n=1 Tax=Brachypodium distachyon TaxID=15368 RepID=A0A2K2CMD3_BRADI|nr:hypothetical protein BRADI_4g12812v3 [Brachypodium distachyon]